MALFDRFSAMCPHMDDSSPDRVRETTRRCMELGLPECTSLCGIICKAMPNVTEIPSFRRDFRLHNHLESDASL